MAKNDTIEKVKSLLEGHCYGPLREAAEKWIAAADEKYDIKEKAAKAMDKMNEAADKYMDASEKFNVKKDEISEKVGSAYDKISEKAAPVIDKVGDAAAPAIDKLGDKFDDYAEKIKKSEAAEKLAKSELIKQLKEGICSIGDLVDTFGSKEAPEKFGDDFTEQMRAHIEELKAKGEKFCDCDACKKARSILADFGEDVEEFFGDIKEKAEDVADAAEEKAEEATDDVTE